MNYAHERHTSGVVGVLGLMEVMSVYRNMNLRTIAMAICSRLSDSGDMNTEEMPAIDTNRIGIMRWKTCEKSTWLMLQLSSANDYVMKLVH